jgi:hypothetical protein
MPCDANAPAGHEFVYDRDRFAIVAEAISFGPLGEWRNSHFSAEIAADGPRCL